MTTSERAPTVTVVIPAYNAARTVEATVRSALAQTFSDLEVIVVDDGSTDDTVAVVEAIDDPRVRVISKENGGQGSARNLAILQSESPWIALLDADDLWLPDKLERQLEAARAHPSIKTIQTGVLFVDDELRFLAEGRCRPTGDALLETLRFQNLPGAMSTVLLDRQTVIDVGLFNTSLPILDDWDLLIRLVQRGGLFSVEEPLVLYRQHAGSISRKPDIHVAPGLDVLDRVFADPDLPTEVRAREREIRGRFYAMLAGGSLRDRQWRSLVRWGRRAATTHPAVVAYMAALPVRKARRLLARRAGTVTRPCPGCGSYTARRLGEDGAYTWHRCVRCGSSFVADVPGDDELAALYASYYGGAPTRAPERVETRLAEVVASWAPYRTSGRVLDVGFGGGDLLRAADAAGWECWGTEAAEDSVAAARAAGWHVEQADLRAADLPRDGFDVVAMVEILEHLPDPAAYVRRAAELLRPGGLLWATTPNGDSLNRRALGSSWSVAAAPEHLQLLSRRGVELLLERAGLRLVEVRAEGFNPTDLVARVRRADAPTGADRNAAAQQLDTRLREQRGGAALRRGATAALTATGTGDTLKIRAERQVASSSS